MRQFSESFTEIEGDQELFMAEKSFLNLTCLIHSVETPEGVFWRHTDKVGTGNGTLKYKKERNHIESYHEISYAIH